MATETSHHAIDTMFLEERRYPPPEDFAAQANAQPDIYDVPFEEFWEREGRERVTWFEPFTRALRVGAAVREVVPRRQAERLLQLRRPARRGRPRRQGRLPLGGRARGRDAHDHVRRPPADVVRFANALKKLGVKKGTPVGIYMGMVPELPVAMLACTRLGAPHTVVFGGFSADSLSGRMNDMECEVAHHAGRGVAARLDGPAQDDRRRGDGRRARREAAASSSAAPAATCRCRRAATTGGTTLEATSPTTPSRARASRWTARTCSSSCTRAARPRSRRGSSTRRPATSSARRRRTTTSSTSSGTTTSTGAPPTSAGSPGTATSSTGRSATGRPRSSTRGRPTSPTRTAGGRSSSGTR